MSPSGPAAPPSAPYGGLPGPFTHATRHRPVTPLSATTRTALRVGEWQRAGRRAPYGTIMATMTSASGEARVAWRSQGTEFALIHTDGAVALSVTRDGHRTHHRSRRFARTTSPDALAVSLTGTHLTGFTREAGAWVARARVDLSDLAPELGTRDEGFLSALEAHASGEVRDAQVGGFGQLGLRDVRIVTTADGSPVRSGSTVWFSATSAGPGFFDTAHTSVWSLDVSSYEIAHTGDLFFRRPDVAGVYGDHATHLVRDGADWLVATSTWGDFTEPTTRAQRRSPSSLRVTLARTQTDPRVGEQVLDTVELPLPLDAAGSVGVWDPHLVRGEDGWWVGYVSAERFFRFHPVLAHGPSLEDLTLRGAALELRAAEGTTVLPTPEGPVVIASEGRDGPARHRRTYPVLDTTMTIRGRLDAPYPTNIPWPSLVPPAEGDEWLLVTFNGRPRGSRLLGYGTHGDLLMLRAGGGPAT